MRFSYYFITYSLTLCSSLLAQNNNVIKGSFPDAKEKEIRLMGFTGVKDTLLFQTTTDPLGNFTLQYPTGYKGAALLQVKELTTLIVLLNKENFSISWSDFKDFDSVRFTGSKENLWFQDGFAVNADAQKKLVALKYLLPLYANDASKTAWATQLGKEIDLESNRFKVFRESITNNAYAKEYLGYRAILEKLHAENQTQEDFEDIENSILSIDFGSKDLFYSGIAKDIFDTYLKQILTLQNKEAILGKANAFGAFIKKSTVNNPTILNEYAEYLIKQYEQYSITEAAEHLALLLLDDHKCSIDNKRLPLLEQYKKMAIGNQASDLVLAGTTYQSLTEIKANYKVIVFGASWCEACIQEIQQFKDYAEVFKTKYNTEIVFISIDTDKDSFTNFTKDLPFISSCDFKGWESANVKNYCVFATPTIYVLDAHNKIVAKPGTAIETAKYISSTGA